VKNVKKNKSKKIQPKKKSLFRQEINFFCKNLIEAFVTFKQKKKKINEYSILVMKKNKNNNHTVN
jgi:hypothetical protein